MAVKVHTASNNSYGKIATNVSKKVSVKSTSASTSIVKKATGVKKVTASVKNVAAGKASMSNAVKKTALGKTNTSTSIKKVASGANSTSKNVKKTTSGKTSTSTSAKKITTGTNSTSAKTEAASITTKQAVSNSTKSKSTDASTTKVVNVETKNSKSNSGKKISTLEPKTRSISSQKSVLVNTTNVMSKAKKNLTKSAQSTLSKTTISNTVKKSVNNAVKAAVLNDSYANVSSWWKLDKSKIAVPPENMSYEETLEYRFEHAVDPNTKKMYIKYCRQIAIQTNTYTGHSHYEPFMNVIKYNKEKDAVNARGAGTTFFHEVGHLIDDKSDWNGKTSSDWSYDFYDKLKKDTDNYVEKVKKENRLKTKKETYDEIENWLGIDEDMKSGVSDLLFGLTKTEVEGAWTHDEDYYTKKKIENEAFAIFFEAGMAENNTKLNLNYS